MNKNTVSQKSGEKHYIIPLPPSGIPPRVMRVIKEMRKQDGVAHVNIYQTTKAFDIRVGSRKNGNYKYMRTTFWAEVSNRPLCVRPVPDWPVERERYSAYRRLR